MCVIGSIGKRKITKDVFMNCWESNSDGFGMAWREKGKLMSMKGFMNKKDAWKAYREIPNVEHIIHFRIGTSGGICRSLTHPFLVTDLSDNVSSYKGTDALFFHNGIYSGWAEEAVKLFIATRLLPVGPLSDTRFLAMRIALHMKEHGTDFKKATFLEKGWGKYILMTDDNDFIWGDWEKDEFGNEWSNTSYKPSLRVYGSYLDTPSRWYNPNYQWNYWEDSKQGVLIPEDKKAEPIAQGLHVLKDENCLMLHGRLEGWWYDTVCDYYSSPDGDIYDEAGMYAKFRFGIDDLVKLHEGGTPYEVEETEETNSLSSECARN